MKLFLFVVTVLLMDEVLGFPTDVDHPHFGKKRKGKGRGRGGGKLNELGDKVDELHEGQDELADYVHNIKKSQGSIHADLDKLIGLQTSLTKTLHVTVHVLEEAQNNTEEIRREQTQILAGQEGIEDLIAQEHDETCAQVRNSQDAVQADLAKVLEGHQDILEKIQENEDSAENAILEILENEDDIQKQLKDLQQNVVNHGTANREGQASIVEDVQKLHHMVADDIDKVLEGQDDIRDKLDKSQNAVESGLHKVLNGQEDIQDQIEDNQHIVQNELAEIKDTQQGSRDLIDDNVGIVQEDITVIMKTQELTQNLLQSCDKSSCDVSEAEGVIHQIKKDIAKTQSAAEKDIEDILSHNRDTHGKVAILKTTIHDEIHSNHEDTNKEVKALGDDLDEFGEKFVKENQEYVIEDTEMIKNTQEGMEHSLKKILEDLDKLTAGKVGIGIKKFFD